MGILILTSMLITGFDAPMEQVMYLDKIIVAHNLLQAIARVNRVGGAGKDKGFVVDYVGVGYHLKKTLDVYDEREQKEVLAALSFPEEDRISHLVALTQQLYAEVERELKLTGFWESIPARNKLKADLQKTLLQPEFSRLPGLVKERAHIISRIMEIAEKNYNINLNWRLIKAPMFVIDYAIVHELAHLIEANHTPGFWNIVRAKVPTMEKAKAWPKENGQ